MATSNQQGNSHLDLIQQVQSANNHLLFMLRQFLKKPKKQYNEPAECKTNLIQQWQQNPTRFERYQKLSKTYHLTSIIENATVERFCECLTYLDYLDQLQHRYEFLKPNNEESCFWLDVGAKNWAYAEALHLFVLAHQNKKAQITGVELDTQRTYMDGHTRQDYAEAFIRPFPNMDYIATDLLSDHPNLQQQQYDIVSSFLPFIAPEPLLAWGLPMTYFQPEAILKRCLSLLKPSGTLVIFNQGDKEAKIQKQLLESTRADFALQYTTLDWTECGELPPSFLAYRYPRYAWLVSMRHMNHGETKSD